MRGLLDPKVKAKVDYVEAAKDVSDIFIQWSAGEAVGKRASSQLLKIVISAMRHCRFSHMLPTKQN